MIRDPVLRQSGDSALARLRFVTEATAELISSASYEITAEKVAGLAVPFLADWCTVRLTFADGSATHAVRANGDPEKQKLIEELQLRYPPDKIVPGGIREALESGEPYFQPHVTRQLLDEIGHDPVHAALVAEIGVSSIIAVPLIARDRKLGVVALMRSDPARPYDTDDLAVAQELAHRAALALDNARLYDESQQSADRFRATVEGVGAGMWEATLRPFALTYTSHATQDILGYSTEDWLSDPELWRRVIHPDDHDYFVERLPRVLHAGGRGEAEYRAFRADGGLLWLRELIEIPSGRNLVRGLLIDVTNRKRDELCKDAERAVMEVLATATSLKDAAPSLLEAVGETLGFASAQSWFMSMTSGEIRPACSWRAPMPEGPPAPGSVAERAWTSAQVVSGHGTVAFPVTGPDGPLGLVALTGGDWTDSALESLLEALGSRIGAFAAQRRAQAERVRHEALVAGILQSTTECVIAIDENGSVWEWNPAAERVFGWNRAEVMGRDLAGLIIPEPFVQLHREGLARLRDNGEATILDRRLELPALRRDGSQILCEINITRVAMSSKPLYTASLRDVTEIRRREGEVAFQRSLLEAQSEATIDGIVVVGNDGRFLWWNRRFLELWEMTEPELQGDPAEAIRLVLSRIKNSEEHLMRIVDLFNNLDEAARTELELVSGRIVDSFTAPVRSSDSLVHGRAWYFRDVTEQRRTEEQLRENEIRMAILAQAGDLLATLVDFESTVRQVAALAVPELADICLVDVAHPSGEIRHAAHAHAGNEASALYAEFLTSRDPTTRRAAHVIATGQAEFYEEMPADDGREPPVGRRTGMCVPMRARGRVVGSLKFVKIDAARPYDERDLLIAQELAHRAAFAVENARLFEDREYVARTLQRSLLPPTLPEIPGVELAARYHPAGDGTNVGGDFYDVFPSGRKGWAFALGDVCGKGAEAAAITALARYSLRTAATQTKSPAKVLELLNEQLIGQATGERFCTVAFARIEVRRGTAIVTFASGGHPLPYLVRRDRTITKAGETGTALGLFEDPKLTESTVVLRPGDTLVFYTDGVPEGRGPTAAFGDGMFRSILAWAAREGAKALADRIVDTCIQFQKGWTSDDIAVVAIGAPLE